MKGPQEATAPPQAAILGQCPKCDSWFACDDFFDPTVAVPCCPHCQLAPASLDYRFPQAAGTVAVADAMDAHAGGASGAGNAPSSASRPTARLAGAVAAAAGAHPQHAHVALAGSEALSLAHDVLDPPVLDAGIPGVDLGVATRPAGPLFGGDTYGAFPSTEGEWTVMLADVAGHGNDAAAQTAVVRNSVDGRVRVVRPDGMLLGVTTTLSLATETVVLEPGDALVLYTDGLARHTAHRLQPADRPAAAAPMGGRKPAAGLQHGQRRRRPEPAHPHRHGGVGRPLERVPRGTVPDDAAPHDGEPPRGASRRHPGDGPGGGAGAGAGERGMVTPAMPAPPRGPATPTTGLREEATTTPAPRPAPA